MEEKLYHYRAIVKSVYDGDTCTVDIDLGLKTWINGEKLRLNRINAPEVSGTDRPQGLKTRDFLREQIEGKEIYIQTLKDRQEKYGRYIAEIWLQDGDTWVNINDLLVQQGLAKYQTY